MVFTLVSLFLLIMEAFVWWLCAPIKDISKKPRSKITHHKQKARACVADLVERRITAILFFLLTIRYKDDELLAAKWKVAEWLKRYRGVSAWVWWDCLFFRPIEAFNCIWLAYICAAQVFGAYKTVSLWLLNDSSNG